ncbi:hypothetical protein NDU88_003676 [Pleurodeles waltl]|uniref:Uncharacterized protein n=1 Tax=Pleurodeles waltl TaxID=8319 RepID=A0AAV7SGL0_PLEWA|nr:hypothetical protein NDU88_003676 [Pleurodeles waltl]
MHDEVLRVQSKNSKANCLTFYCTDDGPDSVSDADKSGDDIDTVFSPPPKKAKLSAQEAGKPLIISDAEGVPMFNPKYIHHPNSTKWFPADHVGDYVASRLHMSLDKQTRAKLRSECPRPPLPSKITSTPAIDPSLITFFTKFGKDPRKGVDKAWSTCQDKLLDVVGPLTRIFDLAEAAHLNNCTIDPVELSL